MYKNSHFSCFFEDKFTWEVKVLDKDVNITLPDEITICTKTTKTHEIMAHINCDTLPKIFRFSILRENKKHRRNYKAKIIICDDE